MLWMYVIAAAIPLVIKAINLMTTKLGRNLTFILIVVSTFVVAYLFNLGQSLLSQAVLDAWYKTLSTQALIWAFVIKYLGDKILPSQENKDQQ
jgi:hypothetical protein